MTDVPPIGGGASFNFSSLGASSGVDDDHVRASLFCLSAEVHVQALAYYNQTWIGALSTVYEPYHAWTTRFIGCVGLPANMLFIAVLLRPSMRQSTINQLLIAIALCDTTLMAMNMVYNVSLSFDAPHFKASYGWVLYSTVYADLGPFAHTTSLWLTVLMGAIRYRVIRSNIVGLRLLSLKGILIGGGVFCVLLVVNVPNVLRNTMTPMVYQNVTYYQLHRPEWWTCRWERANFFIAGVFFKIIPCCLMTYYAAALIQLIFTSRQRKRRLLSGVTLSPRSRSQQQSHVLSTMTTSPPGGAEHEPLTSLRRRPVQIVDRTTQMLAAIVLIFLLTELPQGLLVLAVAHRPATIVLYHYYAGNFLDLMSLVNSSANFVLCCAMSSQLRGQLRQMLRCRLFAWLCPRCCQNSEQPVSLAAP